MANKQSKTLQLIVATIVLLFVLVVLPLGSWYYLKNGLNYRLTTMSELSDYGKLPAFSYHTFEGMNLTFNDLQGKVIVANVLNFENNQSNRALGAILEKLHDQFDERSDVCFLVHVTDTSLARVASFSAKYNLEDDNQFYFIPLDTTQMTALAKDYRLGIDSLATYFTLVDTKGIVRKHYNVQDDTQVKRLVEHLALLLPLQKKEEISLQREPEK